MLVDLFRGRFLPRTRLAAIVSGVEVIALAGAAVGAWALSSHPFWLPIVIAIPLVAIELWFDMRSRSRRLLPELAGSIGIAAVAASIILVGGRDGRLAAAVWLVLAARSIATIPFVRIQIRRLRRGSDSRSNQGLFQGSSAFAVLACLAALVSEFAVILGTLTIVAVIGRQYGWLGTEVPPAKKIGMQQLVVGLAVTAATALSVRLWT
ncbi:MAG: YwiC-like family protein [Ilumatobacteraceae bacterium]